MSAAIGIDLALVRNSTAFVAAYPGRVVTIGEIVELKPRRGSPLKLSEVMPQACDFAQRHGAVRLYGDHHELTEARQHLRPGFALDPVEGGAVARMRRFMAVRSLLVEERIKIPSCYSRLAGQLRDAIAKPSPGGIVNVVLRARGAAHGDLVAALVVAVWVASGNGYQPIPESAWRECAQMKIPPPSIDAAFGASAGASVSSLPRLCMTTEEHQRVHDTGDAPSSGGGTDFGKLVGW